MIQRRAFLRGLFAAPAIVAINNIMPVKAIPAGWVPITGPEDWSEEALESLLVKCHERYTFAYYDWRNIYTMEALADSMRLSREKLAADFFNGRILSEG